MQDEMRTTMFMEDNPAEVQKNALYFCWETNKALETRGMTWYDH